MNRISFPFAAFVFALQTGAGQVQVCPLGESVVGTLAAPAAGGTGSTQRQVIRVHLQARSQLTLMAESLDFDIQIRVGSKDANPAGLQDLHGIYSDAKVGLEAGPGDLSVEVFSQDGRSGEFRLGAQVGLAPPLAEKDWYAATILHCEKVAEHALKQGQVERALLVLKDGFQFAYATRDLPAAQRIAERELALASEKSKDTIELLRARIHIGALDQARGQAGAGRETLQAARAELEELERKSSDPVERQRLASLACFLLEKLFEYERGEGCESAAKEICGKLAEESHLAANLALECDTQARLASLKLSTGDPRGARESAELAIGLAAKLPRATRLLAGALDARAAVLIASGDPAAACADAERGLGLDPLPELHAALLGRLAQAQTAAGRCEGALCTLAQLEALAPELQDSGLPAQILLLRARLNEALGDFAGAGLLLEQASQRAASDGMVSLVAEIALDRASLLLRSGDAPGARAALKATLATSDGLRVPDLRARLQRTLAETEDELGEFSVALADFEAAEASSTVASDVLGQLLARTGKAWILYRQDRLDDAHQILLEAEPLLRQAEVWTAAADAQDTLARIALRRSDVHELEHCIIAGQDLLARVVSPGLVRGARAGLRSRFTGFSDLCTEWVFLASSRATSDPAERRRVIEEGWRRNSGWKGRILLEGLRARHADPGGDRLPTLRPGEACIDYVGGIDRLYAYVATAEQVWVVPLGERHPIEERARELVHGLSDAGTRLSPATFGALASRLYADLLAPVSGLLGALPSRLYVIPSPELSVLPFDCLVDPACMQGAPPRRFSELTCLIDQHEIIQCPSATVLALLQQHRPTPRPPHLLVLADAVYRREANPGLASRQDSDLGPLVNTRNEAESIAGFVFKWDTRITAEAKLAYFSELRNRGAKLQTPALDLYLGPEARLERVRLGLSEYTHLHFAVHGEVDPLDPRRSGLVLCWEPESGGLWPLEEILKQRLDAQLVVLSACTTADGPVIRGEGVQSVANAFLEAGAQAVIATGWTVDDEQTSNLMQRVYKGLLEERKPAGTALREARLAFRGQISRGPGKPVLDRNVEPDTAHPRVWGAWYFIGLGER